MKASKQLDGSFLIEIDGEPCYFMLNELGIRITRERNQTKFVSYADLVAKAEQRLTIPLAV